MPRDHRLEIEATLHPPVGALAILGSICLGWRNPDFEGLWEIRLGFREGRAMRFGVQALGASREDCLHLGIVGIALDGNGAAFLNGLDLILVGHHESEAGDASVRIDDCAAEFHSVSLSRGAQRIEQQASGHRMLFQPRIERWLIFRGDPHELHTLARKFRGQPVPLRNQRLVRGNYRKESDDRYVT